MENGQIQVIGVQKHEKDGKKSFTVHGFTPFDSWENGDGFKCVSEWTNRVDCSVLKAGMVVEPVWAKGYQGKATLTNFRIIDNPRKG